MRASLSAPTGRLWRLPPVLAVLSLTIPLLLTASASAQDPAPGDRLARLLVRDTDAGGALRHLAAFQRLAELGGGTRAAGTPGHLASARYAGALLEQAGYDVTYQSFPFLFREPVTESLTQLTPEERDISVSLLSYTANTPAGGIEAVVREVPTDEENGTGCTPEDFESQDYTGRIALIKRGECTFAEKQAHAADAGAVGALIYHDLPGKLSGTLGDQEAARVPTVGLSQEDGHALSEAVASGTDVAVRLEVEELVEERHTPNVIAETAGGDPSQVVMVGAHLDSVTDGPGGNDNGSGSAGVLATALRLASADPAGSHQNKVRFALWSAEEFGLLGAEHYVGALSGRERRDIALYLNFDMIASPNFGLFVYDGDGSAGTSQPGPAGSGRIESDLTEFLVSQGHQPAATPFNGRSDYGPFIDVGIPAGGTFTGAEGIKTEDEAGLWGGEAGAPYDPCYHEPCDDLGNLSRAALDINVKTIAHAVGTYAWDTSALAAERAKGASLKAVTDGAPRERGHLRTR